MSQTEDSVKATIEDYSFTDFTTLFKDIAEVPDREDQDEFNMEPDGSAHHGDRILGSVSDDRMSYDEEGTDDAYEPEVAEADRAAAESALEAAREEAEGIVNEAQARAATIIKEAMDKAEGVRKDSIIQAGAAASEAQQKGYTEGYEKGSREGHDEALENFTRELEEKNRFLLEEIGKAITELDRQKTDYIRMFNDEMKELVLTIAEKVINVSLKSSGEIIRRMILNAVENGRDKQWAKIYISEYDANIMVHEDSDILDALRKVSSNIKIEVMENAEPGDLLVEYPDQVIDAGVTTQMKNIRQIMDDAG